MPSLSALSALAAFALSSVSEARPIPHSVSLFRRAIVNANEGVLTIQNAKEPKGYDSEHLEPYDHYHFRYTAIGCPDFEKNATFFDTCCHPRKSDAQSDAKYPAACNLESYLIFNPQYKDNKVVAQLGSLAKADSDGAVADVASDKKVNSPKDGSSDKTKEPSSSSSEQAPSSTWTSKSSSQAWTPEASPSSSSSKKDTFTPEAKAAAVAPSSKWTPSSSSSEWTPAWTPSSSSEAPKWTSSEPAPAPAPAAAQETHDSGNNNNNGGGGGGDNTGTASWFTQNGNAGACGIYHSDSDHIVALQKDLYGNLGQQSQYCGRSLTITNTATGATAQAVVADACPGCSSYYSLDLSTGLFQALGNLDQGLLPIKWHFN